MVDELTVFALGNESIKSSMTPVIVLSVRTAYSLSIFSLRSDNLRLKYFFFIIVILSLRMLVLIL